MPFCSLSFVCPCLPYQSGVNEESNGKSEESQSRGCQRERGRGHLKDRGMRLNPQSVSWTAVRLSDRLGNPAASAPSS